MKCQVRSLFGIQEIYTKHEAKNMTIFSRDFSSINAFVKIILGENGKKESEKGKHCVTLLKKLYTVFAH